MSIDNPGVPGFLLLLTIFIPLMIIRYRKNRKKAALFTAAAPSGGRKLRELRLRMILSDVFFLLFFASIVIALAGPRWGVRVSVDYRRGVDLVLAFDLSRSMNVLDAAEQESVSRLERGVDIAREFSAALGDIRLGAAIGKGRGVGAVPLTYDSETVMGFLSSLDTGAVTGRGTNLQSLIAAASASFQDSVPGRRGIILFSDGESHAGSLQAAAEKLRREGIILCAVGLGSDEGGKVPDAPNGFLLAADGREVISARQAGILRNAAERTGGMYVDGSRNDAARLLYDFISALSAESRLSGRRREAAPRWRLFVLASLICLALMRSMGYSRRGVAGKGGWIVSGIVCLFLFSSCAKTQGKLLIMEANFFSTRGFYTEAISSYLRALSHEDAAPYAEYGLGAAYFALEEDQAALERYQAAERSLGGEGHRELKYRLYYNTGIIHFERKEYAEAAWAFREALKTDGSRIEAKRNLELSLLTIERGNPPEAASPRESSESGLQSAGGGGSALFEYLREKEQEQWKSREWSGEGDDSGPDY